MRPETSGTSRRVTAQMRGSYGLAVAIVLLGLCPDLVLSTGFLPLSTTLSRGLGTSLTWLQIVNGLSNAAFAAGVVLAALLIQRYRSRPLFLSYAAIFVLGSLLAATATSMVPFLLGRLLEGGTSGLMLISALPPLITRYGVGRLPWSVSIVNVGLFGASTLGPVLCGAAAGSGDGWRILLLGVAGAAAAGFVAAFLGYPELEPRDPRQPLDVRVVVLATVGCVLIFLATSVLTVVSLTALTFWVPFGLGLATIAALMVLERRDEHSLMPVRELSTQLPVTGTIVAMVGGATFVTLIELTQEYLTTVAHLGPVTAGWLFWPTPVGLVLAAVVFGLSFRTRFLALLVNVGLVALAGGGAALLALSTAGDPSGLVKAAAALLGFGAGATVAPGLFLAGLGVRSDRLGRAFALVQLLRLTTTYAVGPIVLYVALNQPSTSSGVHLGVWITLCLAVLGLLLSLGVPALSGARLHEPDLEGWLDRGERGLRSPATAVHVRPGVQDEDADALIPPSLRRRN